MSILLYFIFAFVHGLSFVFNEHYENSFFSKMKSVFFNPKSGYKFLGITINAGHVISAFMTFLLVTVVYTSPSNPIVKRNPFFLSLLIHIILYIFSYNLAIWLSKKGSNEKIQSINRHT